MNIYIRCVWISFLLKKLMLNETSCSESSMATYEQGSEKLIDNMIYNLPFVEEDGLYDEDTLFGSTVMDESSVDRLSRNVHNLIDRIGRRANDLGIDVNIDDALRVVEKLESILDKNEGNDFVNDIKNAGGRLAEFQKLGMRTIDEFEMPSSLFDDKENAINDNILPKWVNRPQPVSKDKINKMTRKLGRIGSEKYDVLEDKCYVLALSAGGMRSAFQAGAILGLAEKYSIDGAKLSWDVIAGLSMGASIAALGVNFTPGLNNEVEFGRYLWHIWHDIKLSNFAKCKGNESAVEMSSDIMGYMASSLHKNPIKSAGEMLFDSHMCTSRPFIDWMNDRYEESLKFGMVGDRKAVIIGNTAGTRLGYFVESSPHGSKCKYENDQIRLFASSIAIKAVAAGLIPGIQWPITINTPELNGNTLFADGSVISPWSLEQAIQGCQEKLGLKRTYGCIEKLDGHASKSCNYVQLNKSLQERIVIDLIGSFPIDSTSTHLTMQDFASEFIDLLGLDKTRGESSTNELRAFIKKYPHVKFRHAIVPEDELPMPEMSSQDYVVGKLINMGRLRGLAGGLFQDEFQT